VVEALFLPPRHSQSCAAPSAAPDAHPSRLSLRQGLFVGARHAVPATRPWLRPALGPTPAAPAANSWRAVAHTPRLRFASASLECGSLLPPSAGQARLPCSPQPPSPPLPRTNPPHRVRSADSGEIFLYTNLLLALRSHSSKMFPVENETYNSGMASPAPRNSPAFASTIDAALGRCGGPSSISSPSFFFFVSGSRHQGAGSSQSTRHSCQVEFRVTHSKQRIDAVSTRHNCTGFASRFS
jgi:hypothetical protein